MSESLKQKTVKGTIWSSLERFSVQGIHFVVMILMARILSPQDYGLVGMITIFIAISQSIIDSGFSQALIRKQNRTEIDNSTVFFFNIAVGVVLYILLYISAPFIADFYNEPQLTNITRAIGIVIIFNSLAIVQRALLTIKLDFKTQAKASLTAAIISGAIGIVMAYTGFGVWSIVCQQIVSNLITTLLLWVLSKWKPLLKYSWESFREFFSFGSKILISGLIDTLYKNIYLIVIGKTFKATDLGYYTRSQQFGDFASTNITGIFQRVTYPVLCSIQDDDERLSNVYRRLLRVSAFVIFPLMMGLASVAKPFITTILTDKWIFSATLLVPICFQGMWYPVHAINLNLLQVKGRSDLFLRLEIIKKAIGIIVICCTLPFGLLPLCWGALFTSLICLVINTYYTGKLINVGFTRQLRDLLPTLILSLSMGAIVYLTINAVTFTPWLALTIGITEGIVIYILGAKLFRFKEFNELATLFKRKNN